MTESEPSYAYSHLRNVTVRLRVAFFAFIHECLDPPYVAKTGLKVVERSDDGSLPSRCRNLRTLDSFRLSLLVRQLLPFSTTIFLRILLLLGRELLTLCIDLSCRSSESSLMQVQPVWDLG